MLGYLWVKISYQGGEFPRLTKEGARGWLAVSYFVTIPYPPYKIPENLCFSTYRHLEKSLEQNLRGF